MSQAPQALPICPECGVQRARRDAVCWMCGSKLVAAERAAGAAVGESPSAGPQRFSFSLATLMLVITLASVCFGVLAMAPGLGIPLCILLVPVFVRTAAVVRHRERAGQRVSPWEKAGLAVGSLVVATVISVIVMTAAVGTFCAVCLSIGDNSGIPAAWAVAIGISAPVVYLCFLWVRKRYQRDIQPR